MVADLPRTGNISTAAAVDVLQAAPATDTAGGGGPLDFMYAQHARKASVATEAAAGPRCRDRLAGNFDDDQAGL
eukprot:8604834-Heterocapsa_arctica.AAC.1